MSDPRARDAGPPATDRRFRPDDRGGEAGFALLMTLLALVALTALATGGFLLANTGHEASVNYRQSANAFYLADAGLRRYLGTQDGTPKPLNVTLDLPDGRAEIEATRLLDTGNGRRMWKVASTGIPDPPFNDMRRTVSSVIMLDPLLLEVPAGIAGATELQNNGGNIGGGYKFDGEDQASSSECPEGGRPSEDGLYVYSYETNQSGVTHGAGGSPSFTETEPDNPFQVLANNGRWDMGLWAEVLNETAVEYDYVYNNPGHNSEPGPFNLGADEWAVIKIDQQGDLATKAPSAYESVKLTDACCSGQGILIIEQDVKMAGDFRWEGLIMVGGAQKQSMGRNYVYGGTLLGLNTTLTSLSITSTQINSVVANGAKDYHYHSCNALEAAREAGKLAELPGTWQESF